MVNKNELKTEVDLVETLKNFAQAYEEVSVVRMQRVRGSVLANREFIQSLSEIFGDVKANYKEKIAEMLTQNKKRIHLFHLFAQRSEEEKKAASNKTVDVFLSANTKLHGDIVKRSFRFFFDSVAHTNSDIVIVGKIGRDLFEQYARGRAYKYFDLPETKVSFENLHPLMEYIIPYGRVNVYYGQFDNVIKQSPTVTNVSGEVEDQAVSSENESGGVTPQVVPAIKKFIFEPSVDKIVAFFNTEAFSSFVMQTVHESELARLASRINAMEEALSNIDKKQGSLTTEARRIKHKLAEKKQLDALSSISLWLK